MSLMGMIKKNLTKNVENTDQVSAEDSSEQVSVGNEMPSEEVEKRILLAVENAKDAAPLGEVSLDFTPDGGVTATVEEAPVDSKPAVSEVAAPDEDKIQTIPLSEEELENLNKNGYLNAKQTCTKTFVIEKRFKVFAESSDPTNPGRKQITVKRVAELKAVSLMHALNMIGWDSKKVVLVNVKDDYNGQVDVRVNGKTIGKVEIPESKNKFELLSGSQQNLERRKIESVVTSTELVKNYFKDNNMSTVSKTVYVPYRFVNLIAKRLSSRKSCACDGKCECSDVGCQCVKVV